MTTHSSPLRYPGGKSALTTFLADTIQLNKLDAANYVEPFAGGSGAALNLLLSGLVSSIRINDKDPSVYCFWRAVLDHTEDFLRLVWDSPVSLDEWRRQKSILKSPDSHSQFEIGFATFFINRCSHSGVLNGGPIGGYSQNGEYKISARFYRRELARRIEQIGQWRDRISVSNEDGIVFLRQVFSTQANQRTLVYMDPPYYLKGRHLYAFYFRDADHEALAEFLLGQVDSSVRWILSCDRTALIRRLYPGKLREIRIKYSVRSAKVGREFVISSPHCELPRTLRKVRQSKPLPHNSYHPLP